MPDSNTSLWFPELATRAGPIYLRLVEALADARASGALQPGDRLPSQREIAGRLGIDLTTVTRAFSEARRRNLIDATTGRGSFVSQGYADEPTLDLGMNIPPAPLGISLPSLIREGMDGLLKRSSAEALLSYHPGPGSPFERAAASQWLARDDIRLPTERVGVGSGAQMLLAATVMTLTHEQDTLLADLITYPGFIALAATTNRTLVGVDGDEAGMRPDSLEEMSRKHGAKLVYLNPTLHNPTTLIMPERRRHELADVARRNDLTLIEDDPYSYLLDDCPASFLAIAPDRTIHVATLAKCISPFLRTAFLAAQSGETIGRIADSLRGMALMAPPLMTGLAAEWIRSGQALEIVKGVRNEARERVALARRILPDTLQCQPTGFHAWLPLTEHSSRVVEMARRRGLAVGAAEEFSAGGPVPDAIRIALGAAPNRNRLTEGLTTLATVLAQTAGARVTIV